MSNLKKIPIAQTTLSNDFTDNYKSEVDSAYQNSHTHSNSAALNNVSNTNTGDETQSTILTKLCANRGSCITASATTEKAVVLSGFALVSGATIQVTFSNANTAVAPTLNVNSTGAKNIIFSDGIVVDATHPLSIQTNETLTFTYNVTNWIVSRRAKYDSGWFVVTINTTYTKTHGLGTANLKYTVLIADDASGTNQRPAVSYFAYDTTVFGFIPTTTNSTSISVFTATGNVGLSTTGTGITSGYYRIIAEAL